MAEKLASFLWLILYMHCGYAHKCKYPCNGAIGFLADESRARWRLGCTIYLVFSVKKKKLKVANPPFYFLASALANDWAFTNRENVGLLTQQIYLMIL